MTIFIFNIESIIILWLHLSKIECILIQQTGIWLKLIHCELTLWSCFLWCFPYMVNDIYILSQQQMFHLLRYMSIGTHNWNGKHMVTTSWNSNYNYFMRRLCEMIQYSSTVIAHKIWFKAFVSLMFCSFFTFGCCFSIYSSSSWKWRGEKSLNVIFLSNEIHKLFFKFSIQINFYWIYFRNS